MYTEPILIRLAQLNQSYDTTVDNLALQSSTLKKMADDLNKKENLRFSSEETLAALFYARKIGKLPRIRRKAK